MHAKIMLFSKKSSEIYVFVVCESGHPEKNTIFVSSFREVNKSMLFNRLPERYPESCRKNKELISVVSWL